MRRLGTKHALALLGACAVAAIGAGCDAQENADRDNGRAMFVEKCGTCHALAEAATTADVGPDLDAAFAETRASGMDNDTIEGVVEAQIANPRDADPENTDVYMPPNLVTGQDAEDVSAYVAQIAGVPDIEPPQAPGGPGGQLFANNGCGSCHTLAVAQSSGTSGPDLDETLPGQSPEMVEQAIVDPEAEIVQGFPSGLMPQDYEEQIPADDLEALVDFLLENAGKPAKSG